MKQVKTNSSPALTYKYLIAACLASLVISTFSSYFFYNRWNDAEDRYMSILNERNMLSQNYQQTKNAFDKAFSDLVTLRDENATVITLQSADTSKRCFVRVYWNHYTRQTYLDVLALSPADSTKQYQLWAMVNGQPFEAGIFNGGMDEGIQRMKPVVNADAWVVTREPKGGSTAPTLEQVVLISK